MNSEIWFPEGISSPMIGRKSSCLPPTTPPRISSSYGGGSSLFHQQQPTSPTLLQFQQPSPHLASPTTMLSSPIKTPERQTSDRFIPDRTSHDYSMSYFYLTRNENNLNTATPASLIGSDAAHPLMNHYTTPTLSSPPRCHSSSRPPPAAYVSNEPYTQMLARTLFPSPQTTVLGIHEPHTPTPTEEDRYTSSLGVVYEENRHSNFMSKTFRIIPQTPERILDAPELLDDFYLNLVDWSSTNLLTVALRHTVYLWNADTGGITQLMSTSHQDNYISAVAWHADGDLLAIGLNDAEVQVWSASTKSIVQRINAHSGRVGSLSWNGHILAAGSRDTTISLTDTREKRTFATLSGHTQEVCGLRWSPNGQQLASGGNDNLLNIWDYSRYSMECVLLSSLRQHTAAVKALAWNPAQPNLLASGGGTTDRTIRFWDTTTGQCLHHIDTKSQVCGIIWGRSGTELVSSHGVADNQLTIWKYPTLRKVVDLTGHTLRVLHLAMSPDGEVVVSASGDETIRFWRCFPPSSEDAMAPPTGRLSIGTPNAAGRRSGSGWVSDVSGSAMKSPANGRPSAIATALDEMLR
ncbi:WD40 repeat-containing protein, putative [Bodo saltans]|uniref:WD40 repeat-containing protein, putative n=1 Tax=Bodo saltans TaxID=75058 RepID=A0A0S4JRK0_BODSA|nr:WD40 repeat-containing protein, putative [Bodo saltans]|eukprot:CUG91148.1 WD40 repeat-containing protein, putative [Bodo saltans]